MMVTTFIILYILFTAPIILGISMVCYFHLILQTECIYVAGALQQISM